MTDTQRPASDRTRLIDSHCHLDDTRFDHDRDAVLARARAAGVTTQIVPAIQRAWWPRLAALCATHPGLHPAYGLHPMFTARHHPDDLAELERWLRHEPAVALGECGLDFYIEQPDKAAQRALFEGQLEIAAAHRLPVIIHARRSLEEVIAALRRHPGLRGVLHSFSGSAEQARRLLDLGFSLGFGGPVTYPRATRLRRLVSELPLEAILIESDAPDQPDIGHHGQRNEPGRLAILVDTLSRLRGEPPAEIAAATADNARRLFGLPRESGLTLER
ncbi:MAG: TatD family hydrolase [gamma proteobacterium symbiont of Phacoides pectinatus]